MEATEAWDPITALCEVCILAAPFQFFHSHAHEYLPVFVLVSALHVTNDTDARINVGNADKGENNEPDTEGDGRRRRQQWTRYGYIIITRPNANDRIDLYASTLSIIAG